jgi:hypothetical protein
MQKAKPKKQIEKHEKDKQKRRVGWKHSFLPLVLPAIKEALHSYLPTW